MTQADSVHSTPPTNTSAIDYKFRRFMNYPVEPLPLVETRLQMETAISLAQSLGLPEGNNYAAHDPNERWTLLAN